MVVRDRSDRHLLERRRPPQVLPACDCCCARNQAHVGQVFPRDPGRESVEDDANRPRTFEGRATLRSPRNTHLVGGAKRSRTARGAAAERALLASKGILDDPFAWEMLTPSMGVVVWVVEHWPRIWSRSVTLAGLAARVRWFDSQVVKALHDGIQQVAVIGAGYDSRPWRMASNGVQFFELDLAATQQDKVRRAPLPSPVYVESDLTKEDAAKSLVDYGLNPSLPAVFILEGLTMYLSEDVVRRQLQLLAKMSAIGSRLAVDFYPPSNVGSARHHRQLRVQQLARSGSGESFRLALDRQQAIDLVQASGWRIEEVMSLRDAANTLVPSGTGLPTEAVNEHKTLIAAVRVT